MSNRSITDLQLERLRPLVESETGMDFSGNRISRLRTAVEKTVQQTHQGSELELLLTDSSDRGPFLERLITQLTVGESFFFRNEHHFRALREHVIPAILDQNADRRETRIWSAGCATGEEPHSLAILLDQLLGPQKSDWSVSILATDINTEFLQRARRAEYRNWSFRRTNIHQDPKYFTTQGKKICLQSSTRENVRFAYMNLVKDVYPSPLTATTGLDLILFRNVAIYLQPDVVAAIIQRFHRCLNPGGWLLLGEAEVTRVQPVGFDVRRIGQATFFQKPICAQPANPANLITNLFTTPPSSILPAEVQSFSSIVPPSPNIQPSASKPIPVEPIPMEPIPMEPTPMEPTPMDPIPMEPIPMDPIPMEPPKPDLTAETRQFDWEPVEHDLSREDFESAEKAFDQIGDRHHRAKMKLKLVRRLLELSQTARAREVLDRSLDEYPLMINGYLLSASLAQERGDLAEAVSACRTALYLDRTCAMAHFHLALVQQQAGDLPGAKKSLLLVQKLAQRQDANALVAHGDGVCYGRLNEMAQSLMET